MGRRLSLKVGQIRGNLFKTAKKVVHEASEQLEKAEKALEKKEAAEVVDEKVAAPATTEIKKVEE